MLLVTIIQSCRTIKTTIKAKRIQTYEHWATEQDLSDRHPTHHQDLHLNKDGKFLMMLFDSLTIAYYQKENLYAIKTIQSLLLMLHHRTITQEFKLQIIPRDHQSCILTQVSFLLEI